MDEIVMEIAADHPLRTSDRYGPQSKWLRRWALNAEGYPACVENALDTSTASPEAVAAVQEANAAIRAALGVPEPPAFVPPVPTTVSRFQARAALAMAGLLPVVDAAIAASGSVIAQIAWADAQVFERSSPTIAALALAIGLTEAQIDDLFRTAGEIVA